MTRAYRAEKPEPSAPRESLGAHLMQQIIELNGQIDSDRRKPIFEALRAGRIVVYRNPPEIHKLGEVVRGRRQNFPSKLQFNKPRLKTLPVFYC
jgi:hypothetical protein